MSVPVGLELVATPRHNSGTLHAPREEEGYRRPWWKVMEAAARIPASI